MNDLNGDVIGKERFIPKSYYDVHDYEELLKIFTNPAFFSHLAVIGDSQTGKTVTIFKLIMELVNNNPKCFRNIILFGQSTSMHIYKELIWPDRIVNIGMNKLEDLVSEITLNIKNNNENYRKAMGGNIPRTLFIFDDLHSATASKNMGEFMNRCRHDGIQCVIITHTVMDIFATIRISQIISYLFKPMNLGDTNAVKSIAARTSCPLKVLTKTVLAPMGGDIDKERSIFIVGSKVYSYMPKTGNFVNELKILNNKEVTPALFYTSAALKLNIIEVINKYLNKARNELRDNYSLSSNS